MSSVNDPIYPLHFFPTSTSSFDDDGGTTMASYFPAFIGISSPRHITSGIGDSFLNSSLSLRSHGESAFSSETFVRRLLYAYQRREAEEKIQKRELVVEKR